MNDDALHRRAWPFALAVTVMLVGCATTAPTLSSAADPPLASAEAALAIERDGNLGWRALQLERAGRRVALELDVKGNGYGLGVYRVPAGRWRIVSAAVGPWDDLEFEEPIEFEAHPGKLNYLGELTFKRDSDGHVWHRVRNRSGRMLTELRDRSPELTGKLTLAYVGEEGDDWTSSMGGTPP